MSPHERAADAAVAISWGGWMTSIAVQAVPIIQDLAGIASIIAAIFAVRYYISRTRND